MSKYYTGKRTRNLFDPKSKEPFRLSRSKIDLFISCPRCFYQDRRLGVGQPPGFPFNLNSAVDALLKKEFDDYRAKQKPHPLMTTNKIDAVLFQHEKLDEWRDSLRRGVTFHHKPTNFTVTGGIDDVWVKPNGELIIADYKATSKKDEVSIDADWQDGYKRQMEMYQWLFRQNGFKVSSTGYFVYCNGKTDLPLEPYWGSNTLKTRASAGGLSPEASFNFHLDFDISVIPYKGNSDWVEPTLLNARKCLDSNKIPKANPDCDFCRYVEAVNEISK